VAMTRAMYAPLVLQPSQPTSSLLNSFNDDHWLHERPDSWAHWLDAVSSAELNKAPGLVA
jgi:hypothetical protein